MAKKPCLLIVSLIMLLGLMPRGAWAYGTDVHFNLTYVLCRLAGLEAKDALWIADADQSMDDNDCTTAFNGDPNILKALYKTYKEEVWRRNGENWHAFTDVGGGTGTNDCLLTITYDDPSAARKAVKIRLDFLWDVTRRNTPHIAGAKRESIIKADIAMGQFLHFEQDYFSHRQMTEYINDKTWLPYGTLVGHGHIGNRHTPDYIAARPDLADLMVEDSYTYIRDYVQTLYGSSQAAQVPPSSLNALIKALAAVYPSHVEHINTGTQTGKLGNVPIIDNVVFDDIPSQTVANQALSSALADIGQSNVLSSDLLGLDLPTYTYALPYDKPKTPLSEVKRSLGAK